MTTTASPQRADAGTRDRMPRQMRRILRQRTMIAAFAVVLLIFVGAIFAPQLAPYDPSKQDVTALLQPPGGEHLLGTDRLGRDILSRMLYGSRVSLLVSVLSVFFASVVGVALGVVSGYYGGTIDAVFQRFTDVLMSLPALVFAIAVVAALGPTLTGMVVAISIASVPSYVRLTRSIVLSLRHQEFVTAAVALGSRPLRVMLGHLLPNSLGPILVQMTLGLGTAILLEAGLSFLGLGVQPPTPSLGRMVAEGRDFLYTGQHLITVPGVYIMVIVLAFNLLGDGFRDLFDPRSHSRG